MKGFIRAIDKFEIISEDEVEALHQATLQVLEETGLTFEDEKALKIFAEGGAEVDFETKRVRFPADLVEACIAKTPDDFTIKTRDPENNWTFGNRDRIYFVPSAGLNIVDIDTWQPRRPTRAEYHDHIKLMDALPHVHGLPPFPFFGFEGVPQAMSLLEGHAAKIRMSTKLQYEGAVVGNDRWINEMTKATNQEMINLVNPAAPLTYYKDISDKIFMNLEADLPFHINSGPVAGATGPATMAGSIVTNNAESLAGIILTQLTKPGARVLTQNMIMMQNMRTGAPGFGQVANSITQMAANQVWRRYGIITSNVAPAWTDSKMIDYQAAYETVIPAVLCALSGAEFLVFQGGMTQELTVHPLKMIIDDDVAGMIGRVLRGVTVTDETMAVDVINQVGPIPGHFLSTAHTRQWWRHDQFMPQAADFLSHAEWVEQGSKTVLDHARQRMEALLATHEPTPLPPEQEQALEDILQDAREYYREHGFITDEEWAAYQKELASPNYPYG
jgi:trimethylamine--corrinoid protein Co-methyltransferase